ncbi:MULTISPECIES: FAD-dependent oxidoreductase [Pseudomonadota]|uniref:2,4-dichlorophenol 6-monooxygenase n=1 Tax=Bordetella petrii (strain ATCC BAA-461 / DSM 12804 / CCUG 43448 / CIP 107267 / Se-1111R) TaxID=340100 RepID=A9IE21_BORPD|nr:MULTISPECIES: FAD-dependent monooxygenase [Pseudomonadota]CAP41666.1 2,4-dichlorophenol 6-monooxygenase [Bordetella petrii]HCK4605726.1 FAD-dependent monooxygenase [Pseudomonas aeruginosa]
MLETDVVIIGSGPAGSSAALMLSSYGIKNVVITKYRWLADSPRAHYVSQRTMEIVRDLGIESEVIAKASPKEVMGDVVFCTSLTGDEIGRLPYGMNGPRRATEYLEASPSEQCDLPQHLFEPILLSNAAARGSHARFDTEYLSHRQDPEGVTVEVRDRLTGTTYEIRCKYLIGADGAGSKVVRDLNLPMAGQMGKSGSMSIIFDADLSKYIAHRPGYLWWIVQPGANIGGIGLGLLRMVRPWNEWQIVWGYDIDQPAPELTIDEAIAVCRQLIGDPDIEISIRSKSLWTVNEMYATQYAKGRVFCMGDAVHRHPPSNGLGSNTSIQDAYNLCWKLAFVLRGQAAPALLDTYNQERAPVGERIVKRANQSVRDFGPVFEALGLDGRYNAKDMQTRIDSLKDTDQAGADRRARLRDAIEFKSYEFAALGVETNVRYQSTAIAPTQPLQPSSDRDEDLHYFPSCVPGHKLPHGWMVRKGNKLSTLDLIGGGRFTLLCWLQGQPWADAARKLSEDANVVLEVIQIGTGQDVQDAYGDLARVWNRGEQACLLVRPDGYVAWEGLDMTAAYDALRQGVMAVLGRT